MLYVYLWLKSLVAEEEGQDLIEYVLIAGFIAIVAVVAIQASGQQINTIWGYVKDALLDVKAPA